MTVSAPSGYDVANLIPGFMVSVRLGVGARAATAARTMLLFGNMIGSALARTVGSTNYSTAAGTATAATIYTPASADEADTLFGQGSELALMYRAAARVYPGANLKCVAVAEPSNTKGTATLVFANAATAAGVVRVTIAGQLCEEVSVASGDTAATIATNVAHAVNRLANSPVTATVSTATVTLTAKHGGTRGNNLCFGVQITATATTCASGGGTAGQNITDRIGGGTGVDGATDDDVTAALAAAAPGEYVLVLAHVDATNLGLVKTHLNTYAAITQRKRQQAIFALTNRTVAQAINAAQSYNAARMQCVYHRDATAGGVVDSAIRTTGEIAAAMATARLYGDAIVGGTARGELSYPACNLDGVQLDGIKSQNEGTGVRLLQTEVQQLLVGGVTPLVASALNPGFAQAVRCVTTYSLDANSNPTNAVKDTSRVTVADHCADEIENAIAGSFPSCNIAPDPSDLSQPPPNANVIYPRTIRQLIESELRRFEAEGLLVDVEDNLGSLAVSQDGSDPSVVYAQIPTEVIPHLHTFAGELQQLA